MNVAEREARAERRQRLYAILENQREVLASLVEARSFLWADDALHTRAGELEQILATEMVRTVEEICRASDLPTEYEPPKREPREGVESDDYPF